MRLFFIALVILASCGRVETTTQTSPKPTSEKATVSGQAKKVPAGQPRYLMVKVPVDASGVENVAAAESREIADGASMDSSDGALKAFETAKSVTVADELVPRPISFSLS